MPKALKISEHTELDPTLPKIALKLPQGTFYLCFTYKALALAEKLLRDIGVEVNILHALDLSHVDAERLVPLFYAALITHQPKISPQEAVDLVTFRTLGRIFEGIHDAYAASLAEPSAEDLKANPTKPE